MSPFFPCMPTHHYSWGVLSPSATKKNPDTFFIRRKTSDLLWEHFCKSVEGGWTHLAIFLKQIWMDEIGHFVKHVLSPLSGHVHSGAVLVKNTVEQRIFWLKITTTTNSFQFSKILSHYLQDPDELYLQFPSIECFCPCITIAFSL